MAVIDTTEASLTLVKTFQYRGAPEEWSNTYFFTGALPASPASWKALADAVIAKEKTLYAPAVSVVKAIGHKAGESIAVWSFDYAGAGASVPGTLAPVSVVVPSGDTANWLRWSTDRLTSKGKPIYLRSYYHPAYCEATGSADVPDGGWRTAAQTFGNEWIAGFDDGDAVLHTRCGPHGAVGLVALPCAFTTTRTLERRGKRP
jgi:hypothetical protein